ncbi:MAG: hypothetical protein KF763_02555 [Cyclobacteriaceae bacterium]|nr:hypothetical protein [Cyclobacteriaceae bacterium]
MTKTGEISLLPVNSYELESLLTELGLALLSHAREYNFSEKCIGVKDCDFIQCVIIEFISEIKIDFIAYHAVHVARTAGVHKASILGNEHDINAIAETAIHARQAGISSVNFNAGLFFGIRYALENAKKSLIRSLYQHKIQKLRRAVGDNKIPSTAEKFRVLMSTFHPGTVSTLIPIQKKLDERENIHQLYIANRYETHLKLNKLGYKNVLSAWSVDETERYHIKTSVLKDFVRTFFEKKFPFGNATTHFKSIFYQKLIIKLDFAVSLYAPLLKIFNEYKPDAVVLSSSSPIDAQIMIHLASVRRIKVVEITHGIFQETPILKFQNVPVKLVWNQFQADLMKRFKENVECVLVGNPKHDELLDKFKRTPPVNYFEKPYLLFATTPGNSNSITWTTYLSILKDFVIAAQEDPNMIFVIKLHPTENKVKVAEACTDFGFPENLVIEQEKDVYELLYHAEIVMVVTSTVGYEALLFNKKIITYAIENSEKWLPFSNFNLATRVDSAKGIGNAIHAFRQKPPDMTNDKKSYFVYSDGMAVNKTVDIILK